MKQLYETFDGLLNIKEKLNALYIMILLQTFLLIK